MARPTTILDADLLSAAREVFLARGISATSAEVAERAGVSEGTLFKRFNSKQELFRAAMSSDDIGPPWNAALLTGPQSENVQATLEQLAYQTINFFERIMPLMVMSWSNPGADGLPTILSQPNPPPLRAIKLLAGYFEGQMRAGRLQRHDPEVVARTLLGSLAQYQMFEMMLRASSELPLPKESFVRGLIQLLFEGLQPKSAGKSVGKKTPQRPPARRTPVPAERVELPTPPADPHAKPAKKRPLPRKASQSASTKQQTKAARTKPRR